MNEKRTTINQSEHAGHDKVIFLNRKYFTEREIRNGKTKSKHIKSILLLKSRATT